MHRDIDLLRLRGVEADRQMITRRNEPIAALGREERGERLSPTGG